MQKESQADEAFTQATEAPESGAEVSAPQLFMSWGFICADYCRGRRRRRCRKGPQAIGDDAEFISEGYPQKMQLAYVVERATQGKREKYNEAWFGWIKFAQIKARCRPRAGAYASREVLRFLIIETVREDNAPPKARAVFTSDRLEGETIKKPEGQGREAGRGLRGRARQVY
jgi:hypothetical protein